MASEPPATVSQTDQPQGNPSANYSLILGILSLVIAVVSAFLSHVSGSLGVLFGLLYFVGIPGCALTGIVAGLRGMRTSSVNGQGHTRSLGGIISALAALLAFAAILFTSIANFK